MRNFTVPYSLENEDKIIGGYLSLRQFAWIVLAGLITLMLFVINTGYITRTSVGGSVSLNALSLIFRIIVALPCVVGCSLMAVLKINDITADRYVIKLIKFKFRKHEIKLYERK